MDKKERDFAVFGLDLLDQQKTGELGNRSSYSREINAKRMGRCNEDEGVFNANTFNQSEPMHFEEVVKRLQAVRQRIQAKGYPMPINISLPGNWEIDDLDANLTENALHEYEDYEKRMDRASVNTGHQLKPTSSQPEYRYVHDPKSGYTDMRGTGVNAGETHLDYINESLRDLRLEAKFLKLDDKGIGYLQRLVKQDTSQWKDRLAQKEQFTDKMTKLFIRGVEQMNGWVERGYMAMNKPGVKVDPAYRKAFEAKAQEVRQFIAESGKLIVKAEKTNPSVEKQKPTSDQSSHQYVHDPNSGYTDMSREGFYGRRTFIDEINTDLDTLRREAKSLKLDDTSIGCLQRLVANDPRDWKDKFTIPPKERSADKNINLFMQGVEILNKWIDRGYTQMGQPNVNVAPAYRAAFEAKIVEVRKFILEVLNR
jgi:hypothetical protein